MNIDADQIAYLDNNATTQVDPAVFEEMRPFLENFYGNPSSIYRFGKQVGKALDTARERVAASIGCDADEIIFTSCGTEANNAAIASALRLDRDRPQVVTTAVEHSAIIKHTELLARQAHPVTLLPVDPEGQLDLDQVRRAITDETAVVSVMWGNNETGVTFPIAQIAELVRAEGAIFHTDAVQAVGKVPINVRDTAIHCLSLSGHKLHCPKGVGALYVNKRTKFHPYLIGGGQEAGKRGGTENVASIVALGKACELATSFLEHENTEVRGMRDDFEARVLATISATTVNGHLGDRLPNTTNIAFDGVDGEGLLILLDKDNICASSGSACTTGSLNPSHVLTAMGCSADRARSSLRFSFGRFNTATEVDRTIEVLQRGVEKLRSMRVAGSPVRPG